MSKNARTALLIRCTKEDAHGLRQRAAEEHRSVSGCLLHMLERSLSIEDRLHLGLSENYLQRRARLMKRVRPKETRTSILLRCSEDEAARIRTAATRRKMSISAFVLFSLHRQWEAVQQVQLGEGASNEPHVALPRWLEAAALRQPKVEPEHTKTVRTPPAPPEQG